MRKLALVCAAVALLLAFGGLDSAQDADPPAKPELPGRVWVDFVSALSETRDWRITRALSDAEFDAVRQEIVKTSPLHLEWKKSRFLVLGRREVRAGAVAYVFDPRRDPGAELTVWNAAGVEIGKYQPTPEQLDAIDHPYVSAVTIHHPLQAPVNMDDRSDILASVLCRELLHLGRIPNYAVPSEARKISVRFRGTTLARALQMTAQAAGWEVRGLDDFRELQTIETNNLKVELPAEVGDRDRERVWRELQRGIHEVASWRAYRDMAITIAPR